MTHSERYCASSAVIALLARDGIGWGHDLECSSFDATAWKARPGRLRGILARLIGRA